MSDATYKNTGAQKSELLNSSLDSMYLIDRDGTILEANEIGAIRFGPGLPRWITKLMTCLGGSAIRINAIHTS